MEHNYLNKQKVRYKNILLSHTAHVILELSLCIIYGM